MKITMNNLIKNYTNPRLCTKDNTASRAVTNSGHNFDAITIQSNPRQIEERTFAENISKKLSAEVFKPASDEKLERLQKEVSSQSYKIDSCAIASKILLLGEGF